MLDKIRGYRKEAENFFSNSIKEIEDFRVKMLGKKGLVTQLFVDFQTIPNDQKRDVGKQINDLKNFVYEKINTLKSKSSQSSNQEKKI